jgi:DNA-binding MarR family transcriptional regulator
MTAHATMMRRFASDNVWDGASMREYDVLYTLSKCESPQRLADLTDHVLLSQPALSRLVDRLEERGLVARCGDPSDGRAIRISLTDAGRETQRSIGRIHAQDVAAAMTTALTEPELAQLTALTRKLSLKETS